jgi:polysaccharide deacetylase family protein (PEP-CTERM system associated)
MKKFLMTIDVEDWFQVESMRKIFPLSSWNSQAYRVEKNVNKILYLLDIKNTKATFFCLGCIAEIFPGLIKLIHSEGHEVASHGYSHQMLNKLSNDEIKLELQKSKEILENITGEGVYGYRAPTFSVSERVYPILNETGYTFDSSLNLFKYHDKYGAVHLANFKEVSKGILEHNSGIKIFTIPTIEKLGVDVPWGGGGYFRLLPYSLYKRGVESHLNDFDFFMFYMHPWEIDYTQPKVKGIGVSNYFRHYNGLKYTYAKLSSLLDDFNCMSISSSGLLKK